MYGILINYKDNFYKHIEASGLNRIETNRAYKAFDRLVMLEQKYNKSINDIPAEVIGAESSRESYQGTVQECSMVNKILEFVNSTNRVNMPEVLANLKYDTDRFYTREEMQEVCESLVNAQDKVILYGLFSGLRGNGFSELLELKKEDIVFSRNYIKLPNRKLKIDKYFKKILEECLDPIYGGYYYKFHFASTSELKHEGYELNFNSPYVIKSKPYAKNHNGMDCMKLPSLHTRVQKMQDILEIPLNTKDITRSGILAEMYDMQKEWDTYYLPYAWTKDRVAEFLRKKKVKGSPYDLLKFYKQKYNIKD